MPQRLARRLHTLRSLNEGGYGFAVGGEVYSLKSARPGRTSQVMLIRVADKGSIVGIKGHLLYPLCTLCDSAGSMLLPRIQARTGPHWKQGFRGGGLRYQPLGYTELY